MAVAVVGVPVVRQLLERDQQVLAAAGAGAASSASGGRARLIISASCFGTGTQNVQFETGGQTFSCGQTIVDREVTFDSRTGQVTISAVGGEGTYVQWVLTGTATRLDLARYAAGLWPPSRLPIFTRQ